MNHSSFELVLDTTPPQVSIVAPSYTIPETDTQIIIQANEALSEQEIYFVDSSGNRHDYIFALNGDEYDGTVRFNDVPIGIGTLYAKVWDVVLNPSALVSKAINIRAGASFNTEAMDKVRALKLNTSRRLISSQADTRTVALSVNSREVVFGDSARRIEVSDG